MRVERLLDHELLEEVVKLLRLGIR